MANVLEDRRMPSLSSVNEARVHPVDSSASAEAATPQASGRSTPAARSLQSQMSTKPSGFGLGVSEEQTDQVELLSPPSLTDFEGFADEPMLQRLRPVSGLHITDDNAPARIATNTGRPIYFEGSLFTGCALLWTKGVPSQPKHLFDGQRRKSSVTIQGRFKRSVSMSHLVTGPEFTRSFKNLPASWFVENVLMKIASRISPQMKFGPMSRPFLQVPVMSLAQKVVVSEPGHEPNFEASRPEQGAELYQAMIADTGGERSWEFKNSPLSKQKVFDTEHVWTFHMFQHLVDLSSFTLHILRHFDIAHYLDGQPLQSMLKDRSNGEYVVSFEVWHKKLIKDAQSFYEQKLQEVNAARCQTEASL